MVDLRITTLQRGYLDGSLDPRSVMEELLARVAAYPDPAVWISRVPDADVQRRAEQLAAIQAADRGPLFGIPFAVKDNIDVAGMATTMGCPGAAFRPDRDATVVARLLDAGAILIGKTNLDQFATGLVGVRSPYGAARCVFDSDYISGGSSAGSAVAVGAGLVSFSLGTDTAGSGRVPAAFNNIVGVKPTRGTLSNVGCFPANRSLDCISIFANTATDADVVRTVATAFDPSDCYSREWQPRSLPLEGVRVGIPMPESRVFFDDTAAEALFDQAARAVAAIGFEVVPFDFKPFADTAKLLYGSAWVAERTTALKPILERDPSILHPVTRKIIEDGLGYDAVDTFSAIYAAEVAKQAAKAVWDDFDVMLLPTTPTIYRVDAVEANPFELNARLGYYTNFVNLLDYASIAVPGGFRESGLPAGLMLVAPAFTDSALAAFGGRIHAAVSPEFGKARLALEDGDVPMLEAAEGTVHVAVVGAHLTGQPLNIQLTERGAVLLETTRTAPDYRFFALAGTVPPKPGLKREPGFSGPGIEVEVWAMPVDGFGSFVDIIPAPLGIGMVTLADGRDVNGFVAEPFALDGAVDITATGGWRAYLASK